MNRVWAVFHEANDALAAGPFESLADANGFCGTWDDVYVTSIEESELNELIAELSHG